jgi:predicted dehydrogenase
MSDSPFRIAIAGVSHSHVKIFHRSSFLHRMSLVGVFEPDVRQREGYGRLHGLDSTILFADLGQMLDTVRPEAVCAFGSIRDHLMVVEAAAPRGIHVMVEKPLAISVEHARKMAALADRHGVHLLTNYETTWYASTHRTMEIADDGAALGAIRKIVVHDGHPGPIEIGCKPEFVEWLIDPVHSGGGALPDFGCYGANLATRLLDGERPQRVAATTHCFKPDLYPLVEDDATILVSYASAEVIIQASWNWPVNRKDMEVYGSDGQLFALDARKLKTQSRAEPLVMQTEQLAPLPAPLDDPFAHLAAVVRGTLVLDENDLAGLRNNVTVVEILEAARIAAAEGRIVYFNQGIE